jgi:hypothetical protein
LDGRAKRGHDGAAMADMRCHYFLGSSAMSLASSSSIQLPRGVNCIKECQLDLFADRTSSGTMRANQLRLWFASLAYVLLESLRCLALQATADATCGTIRRKLFKIGALIAISVRRIKLAKASGCP